MKIGIITILNVNNYGAELQAFALHHKLKLMGFDNEIINYLYYKNRDYQTEKASRPLIKTSAKNKFKDFVLKWIDNYSAFRYPQLAQTRKERFEAFHRQHTALSKSYTRYSTLYHANLNYDIFMVGSDQVWNPNNGTNLAPYFLTFAPKNTKTISYASSFGVSSIDQSLYPQYKEWLSHIDCLATRETDGVKIIGDITGREATHVVDPTLLLSKKDWEDLMVPYKTAEPYILLFEFKRSAYVMDLARKIQKKTGYKIIRICKNEMPVDSDDDILNIRDFGPAEFLGLYANASIVLTTSFHGSIFSLIFEKPFYTITPASKNNNSRQEDLLSRLNLKDRLIREGESFSLNSLYQTDFQEVNRQLKDQINLSEEYLKIALIEKQSNDRP